ncbi:MAG: homoserine kinase [Candidatus Bathyarchaeia archaeon]
MKAGNKFRRAAANFGDKSLVQGSCFNDKRELYPLLVQKQKSCEKTLVFNHVEAIAPASSANLGAGFDVFGVALDALFDKVSVDVIKGGSGIKISVEGKGSELIPTEPNRNTAGIVAKALLKFSNKSCGLAINIEKGIRAGSGLGSSAASAAAAAIAINEALQLNLPKSELIKFAALGEVAAAGVPHADNVSPSILGFFTLIASNNPFDVVQLPMPKNVKFVIVTPDIVLETSLARSVLPKKVNFSDAISNIAHASAFVTGIMTNNIALMGKSMNDSLAEPYRAKLIPGLMEVKKNALEAGAEGIAISGSGPSILALVDSSKKVEDKVMKAMKEVFEKHGIGSEAVIAKPGHGGKVVRREEA